jgi:hypothetical protein
MDASCELGSLTGRIETFSAPHPKWPVRMKALKKTFAYLMTRVSRDIEPESETQ